MDAAALASWCWRRPRTRDPGALSVLRGTALAQSEVALMAPIEAFDRLLATVPARSPCGQRGLSWVIAGQELGASFIRRALGMSGVAAGALTDCAAALPVAAPSARQPSGAHCNGISPPRGAHEVVFRQSADAWVVKVAE